MVPIVAAFVALLPWFLSGLRPAQISIEIITLDGSRSMHGERSKTSNWTLLILSREEFNKCHETSEWRERYAEAPEIEFGEEPPTLSVTVRNIGDLAATVHGVRADQYGPNNESEGNILSEISLDSALQLSDDWPSQGVFRPVVYVPQDDAVTLLIPLTVSPSRYSHLRICFEADLVYFDGGGMDTVNLGHFELYRNFGTR